MGLYDKIRDAKASKGANYVRAGGYLALVRRVKQDQNRKKVDFVAIEMVILAVLRVDPQDAPHTVGEQTSHLLMSDKDSFLGNFKAFIIGATGAAEAEVTEKEALAVVSDDQPLAGVVVELDNKIIKTKANKDFTAVNYRRALEPDEVRERIPEEILKRFLTEEELELLKPAE